MAEWLNQNWVNIIVPFSVFMAFCIIGLWARRVIYNYLIKSLSRSGWSGQETIIHSTRGPIFFWFILFGAFVSIQISEIPHGIKDVIVKLIASIFIISIIWLMIILIDRLLTLYLNEFRGLKLPEKYVAAALRTTILVVGVLILVDFWGWPITPLLILISALILIAVVALRDAILNVFSGFEIAASRLARVGDFIKLGSGDEGYIIEMGWRNIKLKTPDQNILILPNSKLIKESIINYGHPLKKADTPFRFFTRLHLKELTGQKASYITDLVDMIRESPDAVIYYHTHHFLEEHHYLTPEPANDFSIWVGDALDEPVLSEKLANIDTLAYTSLSALKSAIIKTIEQYLLEKPDIKNIKAGREFNFVKSISIVLPTPFYASDLREFVEVVRKITIGSLYYHVFESRLRLQKRSNDFSVWFKDCLGEDDLADKLDEMVPYTYTLEALRSQIIQQIEKRIK
jgi:hypothetical protein